VTPVTAESGRRILVVSTVEDAEAALRARLHENDVVKLVVPVVGQGFLDWLANDEKAFAYADGVADRMAEGLPAEVVGSGPGEADIQLAISDALATFPADEIVIAVRSGAELDEVLSPEGDRMFEGIPVRVVALER
jgi:hypothetical protein